jgi:energy-coupling factor transport system substrate-specific component
MSSGTGRAYGGLASWSTREIVVAAVLSAAVGLFYWLLDGVWVGLSPLMYPLPIMGLYGFYFIAGVLVPYIIRRPGAALAGELISAVVVVLAGGSFGVLAIANGLAQGLGSELGFAVGGWRKYNLVTMGLAGFLPALAAFGVDYGPYGYSQFVPEMQLAIVVTMAISGTVLGGWLPKLIGDALARTGVLASFAIGREHVTTVD